MSTPEAPQENELYGDALRHELLRDSRKLPNMPEVLLKARDIITDPDSSLNDLGDVVQTDPALTLRILKLVNSGYFRRGARVTSVHQACTLLGQRALLSLITIVSMERLLTRPFDGYRIRPEAMHRHTIAVACGTRLLAERHCPDDAEAAMIAGLVHDIGKLLLDQTLQERQVRFERALRKHPPLRAERMVLGLDHAEMGSRFCYKWRMSSAQALAIAHHHNPDHDNAPLMARLIYTADIIAHAWGYGSDGLDERQVSEEELEQALVLAPEDMREQLEEQIASFSH